MADNSNDIFKQLQQYETQPPADAFKKAWDRCLFTDTSNVTVNPFEKLKDYSLPAPSVDLGKIMGEEKNRPTAAGKVIVFKPWMKAAAAMLVVAAGAAIFLISNSKQNDGPEITKKEEIKNIPPVANKDTNATTPLAAGVTVKKEKSTVPFADNKQNFKDKKAVSLAISDKPRRNNGSSSNWQFNGNDILYTLINYKEKGQDKLFYKTLAAKKITLNQYSYINLSDKMVEMLQDLYVTKKNGKPARKAKKAKKKFEKWRKKDEKYFDKEAGKNPADIIDMSDFLMKN